MYEEMMAAEKLVRDCKKITIKYVHIALVAGFVLGWIAGFLTAIFAIAK
jgi:sorbitol-specific phosphotransferase system component IIC